MSYKEGRSQLEFFIFHHFAQVYESLSKVLSVLCAKAVTGTDLI